MPDMKVLQSVILRRPDEAATKAARELDEKAKPVSKRVIPEVGKVFSFTDREAEELLAHNPDCIEEPGRGDTKGRATEERSVLNPPPADDSEPASGEGSTGTTVTNGSATQAASSGTTTRQGAAPKAVKAAKATMPEEDL